MLIGSGDFDDDDEVIDGEDETEGDEDIESETEVVPSVHIVPTMPSPVFPEATASHPHRHHHGEVESGLGISMMPELVSNVGGSSAGTSSSSGGSSTSESGETSPMTEESTPSSTPFYLTEEQSSSEKSTTESSTSRITEGIVYLIPADTFTDLEDGDTRSLRLIFKTSEGTSVSPNSWLQFDPERQEIYGLPLEEDVSKWEFIVEAMDREGKSVSDTLDISVQHHKGRRSVNHEFSLQLRIEKKFEFASSVDWQLKVLDGLARLYGDSDTKNIVVRSVIEEGPVTFSWTNETLPRNHCPKDEINQLYKMLVLNDDGEPSTHLKEILAPSLKPKKVSYKGIHICESVIGKPMLPPPPPKVPRDNFPPTLRNQVDHINATVGRLLVFKVPEDTFYDPEDGSTRNMKLSLLTMERTPISLTNWLHGGLTANDGLVVVIHSAPRTQYNVEFGMTLEIPFETFVSSASMKRKFVEKLKILFEDPNTNAISVSSIKEGSTIVTWYNRTLPTDFCPEDDISRLRRILVNDDQSISDRVGARMGPEFNVLAIKLTPTGKCQGELTELHVPDSPGLPIDDTHQIGTSDEYLVTFVVPAVIIAAMLILAGIVACVLYRRRRTGKMNVGDEDERQSFRNKGIPVIFQDELEERPDPGNKSPVIMKEEKPPLPPPEYQRGEPEHPISPPTAAHPLLGETTASEDPPYQPPPPFTSSRDSGKQNRPKPTPTYRKPPPYVPP
ncbi:hypothetical protein C0J52_15074 [Blattella germanica]|nr:hypothetical protein C0J52_15074 [Blattella germanica]